MFKKLNLIYIKIFKPFKKLDVSLGKSKEANNCLLSFNKRNFRKAFLKNKKYNISIIELSSFENSENYVSTIKGKNSADYFYRRCEKMNYKFDLINPNEYIESIYEINTSAEIRQGLKMDSSYLKKRDSFPFNNNNIWYGVFNDENNLIAYIWTLQLNELIIINRILGHKDHLKNNVMYFMCVNLVKLLINNKEFKYLMYDTFGLNENGLALFKKRIGFKPYTINFKP